MPRALPLALAVAAACAHAPPPAAPPLPPYPPAAACAAGTHPATAGAGTDACGEPLLDGTIASLCRREGGAVDGAVTIWPAARSFAPVGGGRCRDGRRAGLWRLGADRIEYQAGAREGICIEQRPAPGDADSPIGARTTFAEYHAGRLDGRYAEWDASGRPRVEGQFVDGERQGLFTEWSEAGTKTAETEFAAGRMVREERWDDRGRLLHRCDRPDDDGRQTCQDFAPDGKPLRREAHRR